MSTWRTSSDAPGAEGGGKEKVSPKTSYPIIPGRLVQGTDAAAGIVIHVDGMEEDLFQQMVLSTKAWLADGTIANAHLASRELTLEEKVDGHHGHGSSEVRFWVHCSGSTMVPELLKNLGLSVLETIEWRMIVTKTDAWAAAFFCQVTVPVSCPETWSIYDLGEGVHSPTADQYGETCEVGMGQPVICYFADVPYRGQVINMFTDEEDNQLCYKVEFHDGDAEIYDAENLREGCNFYDAYWKPCCDCSKDSACDTGCPCKDRQQFCRNCHQRSNCCMNGAAGTTKKEKIVHYEPAANLKWKDAARSLLACYRNISSFSTIKDHQWMIYLEQCPESKEPAATVLQVHKALVAAIAADAPAGKAIDQFGHHTRSISEHMFISVTQEEKMCSECNKVERTSKMDAVCLEIPTVEGAGKTSLQDYFRTMSSWKPPKSNEGHYCPSESCCGKKEDITVNFQVQTVLNGSPQVICMAYSQQDKDGCQLEPDAVLCMKRSDNKKIAYGLSSLVVGVEQKTSVLLRRLAKTSKSFPNYVLQKWEGVSAVHTTEEWKRKGCTIAVAFYVKLCAEPTHPSQLPAMASQLYLTDPASKVDAANENNEFSKVALESAPMLQGAPVQLFSGAGEMNDSLVATMVGLINLHPLANLLTKPERDAICQRYCECGEPEDDKMAVHSSTCTIFQLSETARLAAEAVDNARTPKQKMPAVKEPTNIDNFLHQCTMKGSIADDPKPGQFFQDLLQQEVLLQPMFKVEEEHRHYCSNCQETRVQHKVFSGLVLNGPVPDSPNAIQELIDERAAGKHASSPPKCRCGQICPLQSIECKSHPLVLVLIIGQDGGTIIPDSTVAIEGVRYAISGVVQSKEAKVAKKGGKKSDREGDADSPTVKAVYRCLLVRSVRKNVAWIDAPVSTGVLYDYGLVRNYKQKVKCQKTHVIYYNKIGAAQAQHDVSITMMSNLNAAKPDNKKRGAAAEGLNPVDSKRSRPSLLGKIQ